MSDIQKTIIRLAQLQSTMLIDAPERRAVLAGMRVIKELVKKAEFTDCYIKPPIGLYVLGKFKSLYKLASFHYCDCFWDGENWKMMGNDRVEDTYTREPIEWRLLP